MFRFKIGIKIIILYNKEVVIFNWVVDIMFLIKINNFLYINFYFFLVIINFRLGIFIMCFFMSIKIIE